MNRALVNLALPGELAFRLKLAALDAAIVCCSIVAAMLPGVAL